MNKRAKFLTIGATTLAIAAGGTGIAVAGSGEAGDSETPITGPALEQAKSAALDHLGEGSVTDTEVGDEESYYEVEVTRQDGSETDVQLDRGFNVVGEKTDSASQVANDSN